MSYNNIGLTTPRGSGTSGHVQRNLSNIQSRDSYSNQAGNRYNDQPVKHRKPDESILEHERKHRIENKCVELQLELEDEGIEDSLIETRVNELRTKLMKEEMGRERGTLKAHQTHELAVMKAKENDKFRLAMGVKSSYVEGEAFDKDLQLQRKQQSIEEREKRDAERATKAAAQKEAREQREQYQRATREQVQKEVTARREEAERRRTLIEIEQPASRESTRRSSSAVRKPKSLVEGMQLDPPPSNAGGRRRRESFRSPEPEFVRRRLPPTRSPSPQPGRYHRGRNSPRRDSDVYRPSRGRSRSVGSAPRGATPSRSRSRSRSPPRRRKPSLSLSPRRPASRRKPASDSRSRSPPRRRLAHSRSRSPPRRPAHSRSRSPPRRPAHARSRSPARRRARSRSVCSSPHSRSISPARSVQSENSNMSNNRRRKSDTPPPPGFRAFKPATLRPESRGSSRSPPPASRSRRSRSRSSRSDRGGSMSMSDASD